jgi:hypothetical protein
MSGVGFNWNGGPDNQMSISLKSHSTRKAYLASTVPWGGSFERNVVVNWVIVRDKLKKFLWVIAKRLCPQPRPGQGMTQITTMADVPIWRLPPRKKAEWRTLEFEDLSIEY